MKLMRSVTNGSIVEETITATLDSNSPSIHSNKSLFPRTDNNSSSEMKKKRGNEDHSNKAPPL